MKHSLLGLVLLACGTASDTSLSVRVDFEPGVEPQQLRFTGESGGEQLFGPALRPELSSGAALHSGGSLLVLLPPGMASKQVSCRVEGLVDGKVMATGTGSAQVELGREVECVTVLQPMRMMPPDTRDGGPMPMPMPDAGDDDDGGRPPCQGCFDKMGKCRSGDDDKACGWPGYACMECMHGAKCHSGVCK